MRLGALYVRMVRDRLRTPERLLADYKARRYPAPPAVPRGVRAIADVQEERVLDRVVYQLTPKTGGSGWHLVYLHGGAFINELLGAHWDIVGALVRAVGCSVTLPIYPLAPEHDHRATFELLDRIYADVTAKHDPARIVLAGDSAGGNLSLVHALRCRDRGQPLPGHLLLLSPWVDLTMANPEAVALQSRDPMLHVTHLIEAGRWWAGGEDPRSPYLSPLFADLRGLPPVSIYQGTEDVLCPDARLLRDRVAGAGGRVDYHETPGAFHVFMGGPIIPEARAVYRDIAAKLGTA
jgi:acetyl esterase/lipase